MSISSFFKELRCTAKIEQNRRLFQTYWNVFSLWKKSISDANTKLSCTDDNPSKQNTETIRPFLYSIQFREFGF